MLRTLSKVFCELSDKEDSVRFICVLYAISDEIYRLFIPGRSRKVRDVLLDSA